MHDLMHAGRMMAISTSGNIGKVMSSGVGNCVIQDYYFSA